MRVSLLPLFPLLGAPLLVVPLLAAQPARVALVAEEDGRHTTVLTAEGTVLGPAVPLNVGAAPQTGGYPPPQTPAQFVALYTVRVTMRDLGKVASTIAMALEAGATNNSAPSFESSQADSRGHQSPELRPARLRVAHQFRGSIRLWRCDPDAGGHRHGDRHGDLPAGALGGNPRTLAPVARPHAVP